MQRSTVRAVVLSGCATFLSSPLAPAGIEEGKTFPDLALPSLDDGKLIRVSSFRGKKLLLIVFASW